MNATMRPGPEAVERAGECVHCLAEIRQFRMAAGIRDIWLPITCRKCGADDGIAVDTSPGVLAIPPDPDQLASDRRLRLLNIPHGFEHATLDNFGDHGRHILKRKKDIAARYIAVYTDLPDVARLIVLQGGEATGKTHMAVALGRHLALELAAGVRYASFPDVVRELRAGDAERVEPADRELAVLERYRTVDVLILDNVQRDAVADLGIVQQHLVDIVASRYQLARPSVLCTRDAGQVLAQTMGAELTDLVTLNKALWWFGSVPYAPEVS